MLNGDVILFSPATLNDGRHARNFIGVRCHVHATTLFYSRLMQA
jgi:hypothetical protein